MNIYNNYKNIRHRFVYSASFEMINALYVLSMPEEYCQYSGFAKKVQSRISPELKHDIDYISKNYSNWLFVMDLAAEMAYRNKICHDTELFVGQISKMKDEYFSLFFLGLSHTKVSPELMSKYLQDPDAADLTFLESQTSGIDAGTILFYLKNHKETKYFISNILSRFWIEIFKDEWPAIHSYVSSTIKKGNTLIDRYGILEYLAYMDARIRVKSKRLYFDRESDLSIDISDIQDIIVTPTVFATPDLLGNIYRNKVYISLNLNYNAVSIDDGIQQNMLDIMEILSNKTRFRIIKSLWRNDSTTKDIAELLSLSPGTVSIHLKRLAEADLVDTFRSCKYVYYHLHKEAFYSIQQCVLDSLEKD